MGERRVLVDSNVLIHLTNPISLERRDADRSIELLGSQGVVFVYTSQNLAEFWNVCTRDLPGGLGLSIEQANLRLEMIESQFEFLPELERMGQILKDLLVRYRVRGVQVHDARLAALMIANGVEEILTFDRNDFTRYREITVLHPADI